jgi:hypothetical protein
MILLFIFLVLNLRNLFHYFYLNLQISSFLTYKPHKSRKTGSVIPTEAERAPRSGGLVFKFYKTALVFMVAKHAAQIRFTLCPASNRRPPTSRINNRNAAPRLKRSLILAILVSFALYSVAVVNANAGQVTLQWNANTEPDLAGYRVHYGTSSRSYQYSTDVKNSTSCNISGLNSGTTYYFAVTAYDTHQNESRYSDEVDYYVPADSGSTADPIPATDPIVDNGDAGSSSLGRWKVSSGKNPHGGSSLYSQTPATEYVFETALNGLSDVQLWWTVTGNRCSRVPVEIYDGNTLLDVVEINQQIDGGRWNTLGTYAFSGTARVVILSESSRCSTCADALRLLP